MKIVMMKKMKLVPITTGEKETIRNGEKLQRLKQERTMNASDDLPPSDTVLLIKASLPTIAERVKLQLLHCL